MLNGVIDFRRRVLSTLRQSTSNKRVTIFYSQARIPNPFDRLTDNAFGYSTTTASEAMVNDFDESALTRL